MFYRRVSMLSGHAQYHIILAVFFAELKNVLRVYVMLYRCGVMPRQSPLCLRVCCCHFIVFGFRDMPMLYMCMSLLYRRAARYIGRFLRLENHSLRMRDTCV